MAQVQQRKLVHKQFNSPIALYSDENVQDKLNKELKLLSNGAVGWVSNPLMMSAINFPSPHSFLRHSFIIHKYLRFYCLLIERAQDVRCVSSSVMYNHEKKIKRKKSWQKTPNCSRLVTFSPIVWWDEMKADIYFSD